MHVCACMCVCCRSGVYVSELILIRRPVPDIRRVSDYLAIFEIAGNIRFLEFGNLLSNRSLHVSYFIWTIKRPFVHNAHMQDGVCKSGFLNAAPVWNCLPHQLTDDLSPAS